MVAPYTFQSRKNSKVPPSKNDIHPHGHGWETVLHHFSYKFGKILKHSIQFPFRLQQQCKLPVVYAIKETREVEVYPRSFPNSFLDLGSVKFTADSSAMGGKKKTSD